MERLTEWNGEQTRHAYYPRCFEEPCYGSGCKIEDCPYEEAACDRLAAYEDTGMTPEEIYKAYGELCLLESALKNYGSHKRMKELAEADKDGRVVVLPCKVGNTAYYLNGKFIIDFEVIGYMVDERGAWSFMGEHHEEKTGKVYYCDPDTEKIGKTVFLTREEAEKALAELEGKA